jgi:hypothetical protein
MGVDIEECSECGEFDGRHRAPEHKVVEGCSRWQSPEGKVAAPAERRHPNATGWWARARSGKVEWFWVDVFDDAPAGIWVEAISNFIPVTDFSPPLTTWYGPVSVPWTEDADVSPRRRASGRL